MTIVNVEKSENGNYIPPFMINYTKEQADTIYKLGERYTTKEERDKEDLGPAQWLAYYYRRIPEMILEDFAEDNNIIIDEVTLTYEQYQNDWYAVYCKPGLYPRKTYEDTGRIFSCIDEPARWIRMSNVTPEQKLGYKEAEDYHKKQKGYILHPNDIIEHFENQCSDLHYITEKVLVIDSCGNISIDFRRKFDSMSEWIWWQNEGDDIKAWMKIPKFE